MCDSQSATQPMIAEHFEIKFVHYDIITKNFHVALKKKKKNNQKKKKNKKKYKLIF